jgi:hypothetical protein
MGSTATVFMAVNCYVGWWYQRLIRHRFTDAVKAMYEYMPPLEGGSPNEDGNSGPIRENEVASLLDGGPDSAEEGLLSQYDQTSAWAEGAIEAVNEHIGADPSSSRRGSSTRDMSLESRPSKAWAHTPIITASDESMGDEIELLLNPTTDRAMAGT